MSYMAIFRREAYAKGIEQGMEKGIEQGIGEGRVSTLIGTLQKQLKLKFRTLDDSTLQRLEHASEAELELWTERILFANSVDEVFAPQ